MLLVGIVEEKKRIMGEGEEGKVGGNWLVFNIRLLFALMKWIAKFMKRWYSKNGSDTEETRKTHNLNICQCK